METIRKVTKSWGCSSWWTNLQLLLSDYLEKIAGDIYLTGQRNSLVRTSCIFDVSSQIVMDICGRRRKVQPWFLDNLLTLSTQCLKLNLVTGQWRKVLSMTPYEKFIGPWKLKIDIFGNIFHLETLSITRLQNQLVPLKKGISFPLSYYRPLVREIFNLLERYTTLKSAEDLLCYKSTHSPLEKCDICSPFKRFLPNDEVFPIESLANNNWLLSEQYSNNFYLLMTTISMEFCFIIWNV